MRGGFKIPTAEEAPTRDEVLAAQGIPASAALPDRVEWLVGRACRLYERRTRPRGIWEVVRIEDFAAIYRGDGRNAERTPLELIYPRAERLALFAVTLGESLGRAIDELFRANEPALGHMLDAVASERADRAAQLTAERFLDRSRAEGVVAPEARALPDSPGYCGWHVSGQQSLFARLRPERIGIRLNASFLMSPLKSVSGVIVVARPAEHDFPNDFDFCESCETHECRARVAGLLPNAGASETRKERE